MIWNRKSKIIIRTISTSQIFFSVLFAIQCTSAQENTVGLLHNKTSDQGFILFAPMSHQTTYLINREGQLVHQWESEFVPGLTAYLAEDGSLYRAGRVTDATYINSGGAGGVIERLDWDGNVLWQFKYADLKVRQHHDFEVMPNGNVLLIAWEEKSKPEAISAGRDPASMGAEMLWPDHLVEIKPMGFSGGEIIWEWHVWDHLIQDFDPSMSNFGTIHEHPELIDINYFQNKSADWIHGNAIEYNSSLDQIMFSSRVFNEIWIIDHSTTTTEAVSHEGGLYGRGGDLLFRWGNPATYSNGADTLQQLFGQHGMDWYDDNSVLIFNNGHGRQDGSFASVELVNLAGDNGNYPLTDEKIFGPTEASQTFFEEDSNLLFAPLFSNVEYLPNGHMLLCLGPRGIFLEYDPDHQLTWKYVSPILENGSILHQGDDIGDQFSSNNSVFRVNYYPADFRGFDGKGMDGKGVLEGERIVSATWEYEADNRIYPNPARDVIYLESQNVKLIEIKIYDQHGRLIRKEQTLGQIDVGSLESGIYFINSSVGHRQKIVVTK